MGQTVNKTLDKGLFPWELKEPLHAAAGFTMSCGNLKLFFAYALYAEGVLLLCYEKIGDAGATPWRRHWTSIEAAVDAAENLVGDAEEYVETLGGHTRPVEDLDVDDFIQHLHMRLNNELH